MDDKFKKEIIDRLNAVAEAKKKMDAKLGSGKYAEEEKSSTEDTTTFYITILDGRMEILTHKPTFRGLMLNETKDRDEALLVANIKAGLAGIPVGKSFDKIARETFGEGYDAKT